jgi:uncharacterized protein YjeT (DUF2065 family)
MKMGLSIFLARIIGIYLLIVSISVILNIKRFRSIVDDIMQHPGLQLVMGFNILVMGILLVVTHNIWVASWELIITLIAWCVLIKGILNVAFPSTAKKFAKYCLRSKNAVLTIGMIDLIIGLFLVYIGFYSSVYLIV